MRWLWRYISLRRLREGPLRVMLTLCGIAAGVSSLVATGAANEAIIKGFRSTLEAVGGTADLVVTGGVEGGLPDDLADRVRTVPGVKSASPAIIEIGKLTDGTQLQVFGADLAAGDVSRGFNAFGAGDAMPDPVAFLNDPDAILLSRKFAAERGLEVGGRLPMRTSGGVREFHVLGLVADEGAARAFGGRVAVMDLFTAEAAFGRGPHVDRIDVALVSGEGREAMRAAVQRVVGDGPSVDLNQQRSGAVEQMLRSFQVGLVMGSAVSLFVGLFLVFNTVSFAVAQRRREIGTLRALGVSRLQVTVMFAAEAGVYGVLGGLAGLGVGALMARFAVKQALGSINNAYLSVNVDDVRVSAGLAFTALGMGVVGAVVAALVPAAEAARVAPVDALRRDRTSQDERPPTVLGRLSGLFVAALALPLLQLPLVGGAPLFGNLALAAIALGAAMSASSAVEFVHALLRRPVAALFGAPGRIALAGLTRARRRSGVAAGAVLIGIALVLCLATFVESFRGALVHWIERAIPADLFVVSGATTIGHANTAIDPEVGDDIGRLEGVEDAEKVRLVWTEARGLRIGVFALEWQRYVQRARPLVTMGRLEEISPALERGAIVVSDNLVRRLGLHLGDSIELRTPGGRRGFEVAGAIVDYSSDQGIVLFDRPVYEQVYGDHLLDSVDVFLAKGADPERVRRDIERRLGDRYDLRVSTNVELRRAVMDLIDDFFALVYVLLFIAVAVGVLGVVGTLLAQVLDRTREIGILRASGASRGQIVGAVTIEAALLGIAGALLGLPAGALMGAVFVQVVGVQATGWLFPLVVPVGVGLSAAAGSILFAAAGGVFPARRAAGLDVVEAISYE